MGGVLGKGGIRVCVHPTGSCGFAHANKLVLEAGHYVMHGDQANHLLPAPSISLQDAEDYPEELQTLMNTDLSTDKLAFLVEHFKPQEDAGEVGAAQGVEDVSGMDLNIGSSPLKRARLDSEDDAACHRR